MRRLLAYLSLAALLIVSSCASSKTSINPQGCVKVIYQKPNGQMVENPKWYERSWNRKLIFYLNCDSIPDYSYWEYWDDLGGWRWRPETVNINAEKYPDLAKRRPWLVGKRDTTMLPNPSSDDFGYKRQ